MNDASVNDDLKAAALSALAEVQDPEIGENLMDLGVVAELRLQGQVLQVTLIPTSAASRPASAPLLAIAGAAHVLALVLFAAVMVRAVRRGA